MLVNDILKIQCAGDDQDNEECSLVRIFMMMEGLLLPESVVNLVNSHIGSLLKVDTQSPMTKVSELCASTVLQQVEGVKQLLIGPILSSTW